MLHRGIFFAVLAAAASALPALARTCDETHAPRAAVIQELARLKYDASFQDALAALEQTISGAPESCRDGECCAWLRALWSRMEKSVAQGDRAAILGVVRLTRGYLVSHLMSREEDRVRLLVSSAECFRRAALDMRSGIAAVIEAVPLPKSRRARAHAGELLCRHGLEVGFGSRRQAGATADDVMRAFVLAKATWRAIEHVSRQELAPDSGSAREAKAYFARGCRL